MESSQRVAVRLKELWQPFLCHSKEARATFFLWELLSVAVPSVWLFQDTLHPQPEKGQAQRGAHLRADWQWGVSTVARAVMALRGSCDHSLFCGAKVPSFPHFRIFWSSLASCYIHILPLCPSPRDRWLFPSSCLLLDTHREDNRQGQGSPLNWATQTPHPGLVLLWDRS